MKTMKYLSMMLMMLALSVCVVSCGDDDPSEVSGNALITGRWESSEMRINYKEAVLRVEFSSNNKGSLSAIYTDGTDPDTYNFEYVLKKEVNGDTYLTIVWTGNFVLIYDENVEYKITITPSRLVWGGYTYIRK